MKRITRWSPDTCGCILEYEWDDAQDENTRTHSFKRIIKTCPEHAVLAGKPHYDQVLSENTRKNIGLNIIQKNHPEVTDDNYLWWFDKGRILQVSLVGITLGTAKGEKLQSDFDKQFGKDKVRLV